MISIYSPKNSGLFFLSQRPFFPSDMVNLRSLIWLNSLSIEIWLLLFTTKHPPADMVENVSSNIRAINRIDNLLKKSNEIRKKAESSI